MTSSLLGCICNIYAHVGTKVLVNVIALPQIFTYI